MVLNDWIRGKLPWFTPPPFTETEGPAVGIEGRDGALGEMSKKRKRDVQNEATPSVAAQDDAEKTDGEFDGFSEDEDDDSVEADLAGGVSLETPEVDDDDESDDDEAVEADLAAISAALSKAKKRQRKA